MSAATSIAILGIAVALFFGLGGSDLVFATRDRVQNELSRRGTEETETTRRQSERDAETKTPDVKSSDKRRKNEKTIGDLQEEAGIVETAKSITRRATDTQKLEERKQRKPTRTRAFKKSGAEVTRRKLIEEVKAFEVLRKSGATFGGTGKFGRPRLFGNPNAELGLPSNATQADRDRVLQNRIESAKRLQRGASSRQKLNEEAKQFEGKSQAELLEIAKSKGVKVNGRLSAKSLVKILERVN